MNFQSIFFQHGTPPGTPLVMPVDATQQSQSALISQPPSSTQVTTNGGDNIAGSYLNNGNGNGGGGKQRTNLMARTAASQNLPPYPKGHYCYSSTTKNSLKANNDSHKAIMRSPKHRLLQVYIVVFPHNQGHQTDQCQQCHGTSSFLPRPGNLGIFWLKYALIT